MTTSKRSMLRGSSPTWRRLTLIICSLFILAACTTKPKQDYDVNYDFSALKTFSQLSVEQTNDPLTADRINADIKQSLLNQGFVYQPEGGDFIVNYAFVTQDKEKDSSLSIGLGSGTWGSKGGIGLGTSIGIPLGSNIAKTQTIQIDIVDSTDKRLIWRGNGQYHFDQGGEDKAKGINETVAAILAQFPPQK
ncbi:DUF4136 domain-containing protein [Shewanella saliphila]|uniref:DUF4136 domain-containing protein n=1 Tax=Shewanella saliphila TaxID=2282698 RepID=A0ABQ2Q8X6_9GAMM|nr:hypothetical protein GCM10009409_30330 [Shewanella saliphila]